MATRQNRCWLGLIGLTVSLLTTIASCFADTIPAATFGSQLMVPATPAIDAKAYILMDFNSGRILAEKNADMHLPPASLTKLMSLYLIFDDIKRGTIHWNDRVTITTKAWKTSGSRMFIKPNDDVAVQDLVQGIIVDSGNDATVAMAEYIGGGEEAFTSMMNNQAQQLGLANSHFTDSTGLPNKDHYSTARDFAMLAQALIKKFPENYHFFGEKWFVYNHIKQPNRNRLLWRLPEVDGLKTGHTDDAGYCLVSSAIKNGTRFISVVMGAPNDTARSEDSTRLLTYGLRFYETHKLYSANTKLTTARIWKGENKQIPLGIVDDYYITIPRDQFKRIEATINIREPLQAPIAKGQNCGTVTVMLNHQVVAEKPLVALAVDDYGSWWRRMVDNVSYRYHQLFSSPPKTETNNA